MTFEQLQLSPVMDQRARELLVAFPSVQFLSGRRDIQSQAHAMSCHVVTDRTWIQKTYLHAASLQTAVDHYSGPWTVDNLETVLSNVLYGMSSDELAHVSDHLNGDAVDLAPLEDSDGTLTPTGQEVLKWIHDCPDTKTMLTREGGKVIWHWACKPSVEV